jgi:hypothetical protein
MIPKGKLLALVLVFGAVGTLAATGAFTTVEAERTANVTVAGDANALLAVQPIEDEGNSDFINQQDTQGQAFEINLDGDNDGVNTNATTTAEDIFNITNNGEESVTVWINTENGAQANNDAVNTTFYIDDREVGDNVTFVSGTSADNYVPIGNRVDEFTAFVDDNGVGSGQDIPNDGTDYVISEQGGSSIDQSASTATAVRIDPGQSVRVSMAIEIERSNDLNLGENQQILGNVTILAANDDEADTSLNPGLEATSQ